MLVIHEKTFAIACHDLCNLQKNPALSYVHKCFVIHTTEILMEELYIHGFHIYQDT